MKSVCLVLIAWATMTVAVFPQQVSDTAFSPPVPSPMYKTGSGPVILLDEAHFNFHTADGRYQPFAALLRRDGYTVTPSKSAFSDASLKAGKILVVANALAEKNKDEWILPTPVAFTASEVDAVQSWVKKGGSLLLISKKQ